VAEDAYAVHRIVTQFVSADPGSATYMLLHGVFNGAALIAAVSV